MGRLSLAVLEERLVTIQAQLDGILVDVAEELRAMQEKVERSDAVCTKLANRLLALELRRQRRGK